ncbi:hypothetical protein CURTO8I2_280101 [Curtobacterium sp. 8I-2]|nr:hypothetical protein CURTO8I2_280101 [Curtobacterium sp. 8I-2]
MEPTRRVRPKTLTRGVIQTMTSSFPSGTECTLTRRPHPIHDSSGARSVAASRPRSATVTRRAAARSAAVRPVAATPVFADALLAASASGPGGR